MSDRTGRGGGMSDGEVKARLAQAEVHFSHYRWDDAIATFEAILAARPDHPAATQGWANAVEQKNIDEELGQALTRVRSSLAAQRFDEALVVLNHAQTRGALSHILKYHSEIDGLRSEAQEGLEWQQRIAAARGEAEGLAARRRFDQALEVLDNVLRPLKSRGWDRLGTDLAALRERLWSERGLSERIQFAQAAYDGQDYRLATELAASLREELPDREDVRQLHERSRGAWKRIQDQLAAVQAALGENREDDALALLGALRSEHPHNPDWQAIALRVHMDQGRLELGRGRGRMVEQEFNDAAEAFQRSLAAFTATVEVFPEHPTAAAERAEAEALRDAALAAGQAVRDRAAQRWEASRRGWETAQEQLGRAMAVRGRDFGEVAAVVNGRLGEAEAVLAALEDARRSLLEGRQALESRDPGAAREAFRAGLARMETGQWGEAGDAKLLREQLAAGLRDAERVQREVKKLLTQADAARAESRRGERLGLLRQAYERWETAPGLTARLADELLSAAAASAADGDDEAALAWCEQVRELTDPPAAILAQAGDIETGIRARREGGRIVEAAAALLRETNAGPAPSPEKYGEALDLLRKAEIYAREAPELAPRFEELRAQAEDGRRRASAAAPHLAGSETRTAAGDWPGAARELAAGIEALGPLARPELHQKLARVQAAADVVERALASAQEGLRRADAMYEGAADGDLAAVDWDALAQALKEARRALRPAQGLPSPLPRAWEDTRRGIEALAQRAEALRRALEKVAAGRGVEAIPLLQAAAAEAADPVTLAVLARLFRETGGDAESVGRGWLLDAARAVARGELATAEASLLLARSYAEAAPQIMPEIRRNERQIAGLAQVRAATAEAREHARNGASAPALAAYRRALELATDGETGLPAAARRKLGELLDLEDELRPTTAGGAGREDDAVAQARRLFQELLAGNERGELLDEFVAPALRQWWKLAWRAAALAQADAQMMLGRAAEAAAAAAALVDSYPRDPQHIALYKSATSGSGERALRRMRAVIDRARRLAEQGAYAEAVARLSEETEMLAAAAILPGDLDQAEAAESLAAEMADLGRELESLAALQAQLRPLVDAMRQQGLEGQFADALATRSRAELIDPGRRVEATWKDLDQLAALIVERQNSQRATGTATGDARGAEQDTPERTAPRVAARVDQTENERIAPAPSQSSVAAGPRGEAPAGEGEWEPKPELAPYEAERQTQPEARLPAMNTAPTPEGRSENTAEETPAPAAPLAPTPALPVEPAAPPEPLAPFDLDDWLSNVTDLAPNDEAGR